MNLTLEWAIWGSEIVRESLLAPHLPMVGEWMALPIIHAAGGRSAGDAVFQAYQYPVAHRLLECCDAVLRIPGESRGADLDVDRARQLGLHMYTHVGELPMRSNKVRSTE